MGVMPYLNDQMNAVWSGGTVGDRLKQCISMLHIHRMCTDKEHDKIQKRILKAYQPVVQEDAGDNSGDNSGNNCCAIDDYPY